MSLFENPRYLDNEARDLYDKGHWSAAALTWARSKAAARMLGEHATAFHASIWEASAWIEHGDQIRALGLLLSSLSNVPPDAEPYDSWLGNTYLFFAQMERRPELVRLRKILADLEALAIRHSHSAGDLHLCRGQIALARGEWEEALNHFSRGWQAFDGTGSVKFHFAWRAMICCLSLKRRSETKSWLKHLSVTEQDKYEFARRSLRAGTLLLALETGDRDAVAECVYNGCGWDHFELRGHLFLRGASLDDLHDPAEPSHPARRRAAIRRVQSVHERYEKMLALVDYRLACLRFSAGLPAVDDLYYRRPDAISRKLKVGDQQKFQRQLRGFHLSWHLLLRNARSIDVLLGCNWRTAETASRLKRCRDIVLAVNSHEKLPYRLKASKKTDKSKRRSP
jgi:hypothetical protein